jgi:D-psicose/D-tagatose/L-ribulose 3-epimerase
MLFGASTFIWVSPFSNENLWLVKKVKQFGFDLIEICIETPNVIDPFKVKVELDIVGIGAIVCGAFGPNRDISSNEQTVQQKGKEYIKTCIDYAEILGSPSVIGPMYSATGKARLLSQEEKKKQWDLAVSNLKPIAEYAEKKGIKLAIEPLNRFETDFINTVEQGLEFISRVGYDSVGLLLDSFHMNIEEKNSARAIEMAGEKVFHFHACSNDRGTPGDGQINWQEIAEVLKKINYQGPVVIESFTPEIKEIARAVSLWRPIAKDQDSLARDGLAFLNKILLKNKEV